MSGVVISIAHNGYDRAYARCKASQVAYARRHGYEYVLVDHPRGRIEPALSAWLKVPTLRAALLAGHDWVMYVDIDCEIQPGCPPIASAFDRQDAGKAVLMANGRSGRLNSGVIVARRSPAAIDFLDRVMASATEDVPDEMRASLKYENGNIIWVAEGDASIGLLHEGWNNSQDPAMRDFIRHYTGPMRAHYPRSVVAGGLSALRKRLRPAPRPQPVRRSLSFRADLDRLTAAVVAAEWALRTTVAGSAGIGTK
jgi:hypothetical protein